VLLLLLHAPAARLATAAVAVGDSCDVALNTPAAVAPYEPKATVSRGPPPQPTLAVRRPANGANNRPTAESAAGKIMKVGHALGLGRSAIWLTERHVAI
jgi:hypothetical protein